ncbi:hypothetical protein Tco_1502282 [Tanacetum coccineum]
MDLKTQLETVAKNHQASIQNLETKFADLLTSNLVNLLDLFPVTLNQTQKEHNSKAYQPPQSRNEHVNVVFTRSGKSYSPPVNPNDQQNDSGNHINFDSHEENEEPTPQPKSVKETLLPKPYKPKIPIDVIDEILEEDFNALLDEGSKITLPEEEIFAKFDKFMAMIADENSYSESDTEDPPDIASANVHECEKCLKLETELQMDFIEKEIYDKSCCIKSIALYINSTTQGKATVLQELLLHTTLKPCPEYHNTEWKNSGCDPNEQGQKRVKPSTSASGSHPLAIQRKIRFGKHQVVQIVLCENLGKLQPKADIGIFIGYAPTKKAFRIYNRRTRRIIETIHVDFDELTAMASEHSSSGPALHEMTPATITPKVITPIDEVVALVLALSIGSSFSTTVDQDAPSLSNSQTTPETQPPVIPNDVEEDNHDIEVAHMGNDPYFGIPIPEVPSDQSSSTDSIHTIVHPDHQISEHNSKWTKDHPLENIIGELARLVSTRLQLHEQALFCYYDAFLTVV